MPRNWVWNFNPNPVTKTDEVNGALIGGCAKENYRKSEWKKIKVKTGHDTASGNEVEWQGLGRWLAASSLEISQPSSTIAGVQELYQQLLSTKVCHHEKKDWIHYHMLAGCLALAQPKYLVRHNSLSLWVAKKNWQYSPLVFSFRAKTSRRKPESLSLLGWGGLCKEHWSQSKHNRYQKN